MLLERENVCMFKTMLVEDNAIFRKSLRDNVCLQRNGSSNFFQMANSHSDESDLLFDLKPSEAIEGSLSDLLL
jgi:hypothetical protein